MGELMARTDWASTPLGEPAGWPPSLRTAVGICLESRFPMLIMWGPELVMLYNDDFRPILGQKHPRSMGQVAAECWSEIWEVIRPMLDAVLATGTSTWAEDTLMVLDRMGYEEDCYFTFSYSAIRGGDGAIGGVFTTVFETTDRVLAGRRMSCLRDLAEARADATSTEEVIHASTEVLDRFSSEVPFACLYPVDGQEAAGGVFAGLNEPIPAEVWPLARVIATRASVHVAGLGDMLTSRGRSKPTPTSALAMPVFGGSQAEPRAVLVCGLNPRRALDVSYRSFLGLVADDVASALASAGARERERHQAEALAALDEAKTRFFSNVSHEFRTPLTLLLGPLDELLSGGEPLSDGQREALLLGRRNTLRMRRLVNALLDLSQAEGVACDPRFQPLDLAHYTVELASAFRSAIESGGLELRVHCPPLGRIAHVDVEMWEKIVLNLLSNALKHTWEGQITVSLSEEDGLALLRVSDTGSGIPDAGAAAPVRALSPGTRRSGTQRRGQRDRTRAARTSWFICTMETSRSPVSWAAAAPSRSGSRSGRRTPPTVSKAAEGPCPTLSNPFCRGRALDRDRRAGGGGRARRRRRRRTTGRVLVVEDNSEMRATCAGCWPSTSTSRRPPTESGAGSDPRSPPGPGPDRRDDAGARWVRAAWSAVRH